MCGNTNKTRPFFHINLLIKYSVQQQIHFNGNVFGNKCYRLNEGSLYMEFKQSCPYSILLGPSNQMSCLDCISRLCCLVAFLANMKFHESECMSYNKYQQNVSKHLTPSKIKLLYSFCSLHLNVSITEFNITHL